MAGPCTNYDDEEGVDFFHTSAPHFQCDLVIVIQGHLRVVERAASQAGPNPGEARKMSKF
jgi:hypothetical protein